MSTFLNDVLLTVDGFGKLAFINGDLIICSNSGKNFISNSPNVVSLGGDLVIDSNEQLSYIPGLTSLSHSINLMVKGSGRPMDMEGLANLKEVGGSLSFEDSKFSGVDFGGLETISGDLSILKTQMDRNIDAFLENLIQVGGSLRVIDSEIHAHLNLCQNLQSICSEASNATPRGLTIKGNTGYEAIDSFLSLSPLRGSLKITNNTGLVKTMGFEKVKSIAPRVPIEWRAEVLASGLVVAFNRNLTSLDLEVSKGSKEMLLFWKCTIELHQY